MDKSAFDGMIRDVLRERACGVSMEGSLQDQIRTAAVRGRKEEIQMKGNKKRSLVLAAVGMCLLGTMVAVAAGKAVGYSSSVMNDQIDYATAADVAKAKELLGAPVKAVEELAGGYRFEKGYLVMVDGHDADGNVVETFPEVNLHYAADDSEVSVNIERVNPERQAKTTGNPVDISYAGRILTYSVDHYRFVPPDYEISEEEQKAMDAGELYISYGSREVEDRIPSFMTWVDGELHYSLMCLEAEPLSQEEMEAMAKQIIDSPELP